MVRLGPATTAACSPPAHGDTPLAETPRVQVAADALGVVLAAAPYLREAIDDDERRRFGRSAAIATALAALGYGLIGALGSAVVGLTTQGDLRRHDAGIPRPEAAAHDRVRGETPPRGPRRRLSFVTGVRGRPGPLLHALSTRERL